MGIKVFLFSLAMGVLSLNTSASIIFNFSIDDVSQFEISNNTSVGDSFSVSFYDDSRFITGISSEDIESISFDTAFLGSGIINAPLLGVINANLHEIFNFTLSDHKWTLDLLVGVTGKDVDVVFSESTPGALFQLAQTISGGGSTNFSIENARGDYQFLHTMQSSVTFSAITVSEPSTIAMLILVLFGTFLRTIKTKNIGYKADKTSSILASSKITH